MNKLLCSAAIALATCIGSAGAWAQAYPTKPVRVAVGFGAGGSSDVVARAFGQKLSEVLGQPFVIENRAGAAGAIAADSVAKAEPDGHRILLLATGTFDYSVLAKNVPYNMLRDFTPVALIAATPLVLVVGPSTPVSTVDELIRLARAKPGELSYGSEGIGGATHLATELFAQAANVKLLHIPFKGGSESSMATAGGQVNMNMPALTSALPLLKAEKYRPLAVTSLTRSPLYPSLPTLDELGLKGFDQTAWYGFLGPAGMPRPVVERLRAAIATVAALPEIKDAMAQQGMEVKISTPEQFAVFLRDSAAQITKVARDVNIKVE
jgi:tripartite-type tricarboxylate transporter receptor subunit TctC